MFIYFIKENKFRSVIQRPVTLGSVPAQVNKMEWFTTNCGNYKIESLSAATFPGALEVIRDSFFKDEAVSIATEVNKNPLAAEELLELCADAALDGVSLVAVSVDDGKVVAASFNKLQVQTTSSSEKPFFEIFAEERCTQASSQSLVQFMAYVDGKCNLFEKCGVDCSLELMFLATLRQHRKKTLGFNLCKISLELATKLKSGPVACMTVQDLGPKYSNMKPREIITISPQISQAIWTSEATMKIGKNLGFTVYLTVSFDECSYNGKTYSEIIGMPSSFCEIAAIVVK